MWNRALGVLRRAPSVQRPRRVTLRCESLEDRRVPASYTVDNLNDSGPGSLRQAVLNANANPGADDIQFTGAGAAGTIALSSGQLGITDPVTITGPGPSALTVDAQGTSRLFSVATGGWVTISGLTMEGGADYSGSSGGAVNLSSGSLTLLTDVLTGNYSFHGGAISADSSSLTVRDTTVA